MTHVLHLFYPSVFLVFYHFRIILSSQLLRTNHTSSRLRDALQAERQRMSNLAQRTHALLVALLSRCAQYQRTIQSVKNS